jgi:hypothetical protein
MSSHLTPTPEDNFAEWWTRWQKLITKARWKHFDSLVILVTWQLWLQRNNRVFQQENIIVSALVDQNLDGL